MLGLIVIPGNHFGGESYSEKHSFNLFVGGVSCPDERDDSKEFYWDNGFCG